MTHDEQVLAINAAWTKVLATKVSQLSVKFVKVEPIRRGEYYIAGWRTVCPSGSVFISTTKAEAERLANQINDELAYCLQQIKAEVS